MAPTGRLTRKVPGRDAEPTAAASESPWRSGRDSSRAGAGRTALGSDVTELVAFKFAFSPCSHPGAFRAAHASLTQPLIIERIDSGWVTAKRM